jgi:type I restriction enzyme S subunit
MVTAGEWVEEAIGDLFAFHRTTALSRAQLSDDGEIGYIHYGDIHARWGTHLNIKEQALPRVHRTLAGSGARVAEGDLVLADASEDLDGVGRAIELSGVDGREVIAGLHTVLMRPRRGAFAPGFAGYLPETPDFRVQARTLAAGLKVYGLSKSSLRQIIVRIPPLKEQEAIAEVLSDADAEIEALNALIAKKWDVKQAVMQQLLTGRTRLPGFEGRWQNVGFDQALRRTRGPGRALLAGEYTDSGALPIIDQSQAPVAGWTDRGDLRVECPVGGVIVFGDHTRVIKYVGTDFVVGADGTQVLSPVGNGDARFLAYLLQRAEIPNTGYNRHFKFLKDLRMECPAGEEQRAIASVLSDMDDEIEALVAERDKMRLVKQGMMQELLSGRVRLV